LIKYNQQGSPRIPIEFLIYPVNIIANIYKKYSGEYYGQFIKEAKKIFDKYNNKLDKGNLYFEEKDCD